MLIYKFHSYIHIFTRDSCCCASYPSQFCPSVHLSVTWVDQSKMVQAGITKSLPSAAWKTLVSG